MSDWGISAYYDSSFGSIDFWTQAPATLPRYEEDRVEFHHPDSDSNTIVLLGQKTPPWTLTVACAAAEYSSLVSAQGTSATLDYPGLPSSVSARLLDVQGEVHEFYTGIYKVQLTFQL